MREYADDRIGLLISLATSLHEAMYDLAELHGRDAPTPRELQDRFLGWVDRRARPRPR